MPNKDKDLVLYLSLDEIHNDGRVPDASGLGNHGALKGNVTLVPDDTFGACANFGEGQSSYIEVPSSDSLQKLGDFTIEAWVYIAKAPPPQQAVVLIEQGFPWGDYYNVTYNDRWILLSGLSARTAVPALPLNTWFHLAGVFSGATLLLFIHDLQGSLLKQANEHMKGDLLPSAFTPSSITSLHLGFGGTFGGNAVVPHVGKLANFRAYKRALTLAEIERDVRADCMSLLAFRKSHPIDFRLYDDDEQAVLYIGDDAAGHNLHLELRNTSAQALQLSDGRNAAASEKNHHFALRFRPGTLSDGALKLLTNPQERAKLLKQADQWDLYFQPILPAANETASLYLLYKGAGLSIQPNERRALTLQRMSAAPGSGARGTQVELLPRQLTAAGEDSTPVTGSRTQYVHVTNQRGKKNIPLHVGFLGGNTVLNDGKTPNPPLKLRITNVLKTGDVTLNSRSDNEPSTFIISFDSQLQGEVKEWALVTSAAAQNVVVRFDGREITPIAIVGPMPEWHITFDAPTPLAAGKHLEIQIDNIVSTLATGHANLYVRYQNIPGYWDGQFVCAVEKGPLAYGKEGVGIGTNPPQYTLDVKSNGPIKLGLEGNGGGRLLITSEKNDNKIYLEAFSSDGSGSAAELRLSGKDGGRVHKIDLRADATHIDGALQLNGGAVMKSILQSVAGGGNYAESLPAVAMVVELINEALRKIDTGIPFDLCAVLSPHAYPVPDALPRIKITGDTAQYTGEIWMEAPIETPSAIDYQHGMTDALARLYPPLAPVHGSLYVFGTPRTNPEMESAYPLNYEINQIGELRLHRYWMVWATGMVKFRLFEIKKYKVREFKTAQRLATERSAFDQ